MSKIIEHVLIFFIFTISLCLVPAAIALAVFLLVLRTLLTTVKRIVKPNYGDLLSGMNNFFSSDDLYDRPMSVVACQLLIKGHVDLKKFQQEFASKLKEFEKHEPPWFPELKQHLTTFMGFSVMIPENNFDIKDHVRLLSDLDPIYENLNITRDNCAKICYKMSRTPFRRGKSPWELLLHHKVDWSGNKSEETIVFARFHHSLCDGLALLKLFAHFYNIPGTFESFMEKVQKSAVSTHTSFLDKFVYWVTFPVLGLYDLASTVVTSWDVNSWHGRWPRVQKDFHYITIHDFPTEKVKKIRKIYGQVKFFKVILAALTGGLRKFMIRNKISVPDEIHAIVSIPIPKSSTRLSNNLTNTLVTLPLGLDDRRKIIRVMENNSESMKWSRYPQMMLLLLKLVGLLPRKLIANHWTLTTAATSNVPGFDVPVSICGHPVLGMNVISQMPNATSGIYLWVLGYNGKLSMNLGLSKHICKSRGQLEQMRQFILEELDTLENPRDRFINPFEFGKPMKKKEDVKKFD